MAEHHVGHDAPPASRVINVFIVNCSHWIFEQLGVLKTRNQLWQSEIMGYFPTWRPATGTTVLPDEKLPMAAAIPMSLQHLLAMSGSTILAPLIMGFDPNVAVLFSGIGTLLFFVITGGRVTSNL